jgi:hypothetical protein
MFLFLAMLAAEAARLPSLNAPAMPNAQRFVAAKFSST